MSYAKHENPYASFSGSTVAAAAGESERTAFIRRTYGHLAGAVLVFCTIEVAIFNTLSEQTLNQFTGTMTRGYNWLLVMGAFIVASLVADRWARSGQWVQQRRCRPFPPSGRAGWSDHRATCHPSRSPVGYRP